MQVWTLWQAADLDNSLNPAGWGLTAASYCGCGGGQSCKCSEQTPAGEFYVRQQFFALRQFSAYLLPGSRVLHPAAGQPALPPNTLLALGPNKTTLVFLVNPTADPTTVSLDGLAVETGCAEHILTDATHSTAMVQLVPVTGGKLAATLPAESVNTFVLRSDPGALCPPPPPPPPPLPVRIRLLNSSGLCLTGTPHKGVTLQPCTGSAAVMQTWSWPASGTGAIALGDGGCLSWSGEGTPTTLQPCALGAVAQQWTLSASNGGIAGVGSDSICKWKWGTASCCLDDWNGAEKAGDSLCTYSCWNGDSQKWVLDKTTETNL